jgi:hypothetical protein
MSGDSGSDIDQPIAIILCECSTECPVSLEIHIKKRNNSHGGSLLAGRTTLLIIVMDNVQLGPSVSSPELCVLVCIFQVYVKYQNEHNTVFLNACVKRVLRGLRTYVVIMETYSL